ncbi:TonB C-terminal domain-containing protein [bacterium]|nr:TonB C-terminal domain-containing protein [bacterium]RQV96336.1 MAG: TonB C-terminal domain-containing protein [bacterium]
MKIPILISLTVHLMLIAAMVMIQPKWKRIPMKDIYHVTLVQAQTKPVTTFIESENSPLPIEAVQESVPVIQEIKNLEDTPARPVEENLQSSPSGPLAPESGAMTDPVKVSVNDFPFLYYLNMLRYRIQEHWEPPYQDMGENLLISAVVSFRVMRNGEIQEIVLDRSSGRFLFDIAAQRAVYAANPLPSLPEAYTSDRLTVHIEFEAVW